MTGIYMKLHNVLLAGLIFLYTCQAYQEKDYRAMEKRNTIFQATEEERNIEQEAELIRKLKKAIVEKNKEHIKSLYYLENADDHYRDLIPYILEQLVTVDVKVATFRIIPDQRAMLYNIRFTAKYVGQLYIITPQGSGTHRIEIPVGIKSNTYYLIIKSRPQE
jgi:hypothetical protein